MREDAFRAYLAPLIGSSSVASYISYARRVEQTLGVDLDAIDLGEAGLLDIGDCLRRAGIPASSIRNSLSAVRRYSSMSGVRRASYGDGTRNRPASALEAPGTARHPAVIGASVANLVRLYGDLLAELADRGIARTANGPVGDYAEHLFATALGWKLAGNNEIGFDAIGSDGARYQIKGRRLATGRTARQLSAIRGLPDQAFDILALALFDATMSPVRAALVPYDLVTRKARFIAHANSWRMTAPDSLWREPGVTDVTKQLIAAAA